MTTNGKAHASVDPVAGTVTASIHVAASPQRVFEALHSQEITAWWVRPGVFDTRTWDADLRVGGRWAASGIGNGKPYVMEGEFVEIDAPRRLVQTWANPAMPAPPTTLSFTLEASQGGTLITLHHEGFKIPDICAATAAGWETSLERLADLLK